MAQLKDLIVTGNSSFGGNVILDHAPTANLEAATKKYVDDAIDGLPAPMQFKGSLGTGGTITTLPAAAGNAGFTYKVITQGEYITGETAKVGDMYISNGTTWVLIPSGDDAGAGTVTSVNFSNGGGISLSGDTQISTSGTVTIAHADTSSQASVDNSGRTYIQDITLDTYGHVTGLTSATETVVDTDSKYALSGSLSNHKYASTLTASGSSSGTTISDITFIAGDNISLTDDTSNRKITIASAKDFECVIPIEALYSNDTWTVTSTFTEAQKKEWLEILYTGVKTSAIKLTLTGSTGVSTYLLPLNSRSYDEAEGGYLEAVFSVLYDFNAPWATSTQSLGTVYVYLSFEDFSFNPTVLADFSVTVTTKNLPIKLSATAISGSSRFTPSNGSYLAYFTSSHVLHESNTTFTGNVNDVLRGDGTFGSVPAGCVIYTAQNIIGQEQVTTSDTEPFVSVELPQGTYSTLMTDINANKIPIILDASNDFDYGDHHYIKRVFYFHCKELTTQNTNLIHFIAINRNNGINWSERLTISSSDVLEIYSWTDKDTTYTFTSGTNGFTVTPSGGTAQTVTVTPSITNNITGSGTSGSLAKFSGANTLTDGPAFNTSATDGKYLSETGSWTRPLNGVFKGTCSTPAATTTKAVVCPEFTSADLVAGAIVFVTFTTTNSGAVASLNLNVNSTGAKRLKYMRNAAESDLPGVGYLRANMTYRFVYTGSVWVCDTDYDANTYLDVPRTRNLTVDSSAGSLYRYELCMYTGETTIMPYNNVSNAPSTYTKAVNTLPFDPFRGLLYYNTTTTVSAGSVRADTNFSLAAPFNCRYSFNIIDTGTAGTSSLTTSEPVYIKAKYDFATRKATLTQDLSSSNYLEKSGIVQELPTTCPEIEIGSSDQGTYCYIYIYIGIAYSLYQIQLELNNTVYAWNSAKNCMDVFTGDPFPTPLHTVMAPTTLTPGNYTTFSYSHELHAAILNNYDIKLGVNVTNFTDANNTIRNYMPANETIYLPYTGTYYDSAYRWITFGKTITVAYLEEDPDLGTYVTKFTPVWAEARIRAAKNTYNESAYIYLYSTPIPQLTYDSGTNALNITM